MSKEQIARVLSILLGPQIWLPLLFIVIIFRSGLNYQQLLVIFPSALILQVVIPLTYLYIAPKVGLATAWDLPKREERYLFLSICFIASLITCFISYYYGTSLLFKLNLLLLILFTIIFVTTLYWKISLHTSLNTVGSILINYLFGWSLWWVYLSIPLVFWARLVLKRHTLIQLIVGIIISLVGMSLGIKLLDLRY